MIIDCCGVVRRLRKDAGAQPIFLLSVPPPPPLTCSSTEREIGERESDAQKIHVIFPFTLTGFIASSTGEILFFSDHIELRMSVRQKNKTINFMVWVFRVFCGSVCRFISCVTGIISIVISGFLVVLLLSEFSPCCLHLLCPSSHCSFPVRLSALP